jgi:D-aminoacyl-tRNA deacylase
MRAVVQRVLKSQVAVEGQVTGSIGEGLCVLVGVGTEDTDDDAEKLAEKLANLRIFEDAEGKMNRSLVETGGQMLLISQFTLFGDVRRGNRPSFTGAMAPERAEALFEKVCRHVEARGIPIGCGRFRTTMLVELANDGPVTILLDTKRAF